MSLHGWYKPRFGFTIDGAPWTTDGRIAVAVDALPDSIDMHATAHRMVAHESSIAGTCVSRAVAARGYAFFGELAFQAHYIDLCEAAHPGIAWRHSALPLCPIVGFVGDRAVAIVMGIRVDGQDPADWPEVCATCPTCDGKGGPECASCDGSGWIECDMCEHENECVRCDGNGHTEGCPDCRGTGRWTPPAEPAAAATG